MFEEGNLVTLNYFVEYDETTPLTTEDIGEVVGVHAGGFYRVAFEGHTDENGLMPILVTDGASLTLYQL